MKSKLSVMLVGALLLGASSVHAAYQLPSAYGPTSAALTSVPDRKVAADGAGVPWRELNPGWKAFVSSASAAAVKITDELGNVPTCGTLHQVCLSGGSTSASLYDSSSTTVVANGPGSLAVALVPVSSGLTCYPITLDAQFDRGLVLLPGSSSDQITVYWRPCRGGRN